MAAEKGSGRRRAFGQPTVQPGLGPPDDLAGNPACPTTDLARLLRGPDRALVVHQKDRFAGLNEIMPG